MKRQTDWTALAAQQGVDQRLLQNEDMRRSAYIWRLSQWLQQRGYLSNQEATDARSAVAANVVDHLAGNGAAYDQARKSGVLDKWLEAAASYEIPGETIEGKERRHREALRKTVEASIDMELAQNASPA